MPDSDAALRAASKVSSAHINSFQQNGVIVIRGVLSSTGNAPSELLARAVACRLLGAPACCETPGGMKSDVCVFYSDHFETILGFDIGPGDVLVASADIAAGTDRNWKEELSACQGDDDHALFRDTLFGTRGETPTTVIQWSKGTIF